MQAVIPDLHFDDVTSAQFAIDRQIEQRTIAQASMLIEKEADCPHVARFQRTLRANHIACIPRSTPTGVGIKIRYSHDISLAVNMAERQLTPSEVLKRHLGW